MNLNTNNLVDAYAELKSAGYDQELRLHKTHLLALESEVKIEAKDLVVDAAFRFEGSTSEEDTSELYAISSPLHGIKGILVDDLFQFRKLPDHPLVEKLLEVDFQIKSYDDSSEEEKYGVPKVYKSKFNEDPDRYELRVGFPDFPACPYGNSFSMLGYDRELQRYVWLVNSVVKDERLYVNEYSDNR